MNVQGYSFVFNFFNFDCACRPIGECVDALAQYPSLMSANASHQPLELALYTDPSEVVRGGGDWSINFICNLIKLVIILTIWLADWRSASLLKFFFSSPPCPFPSESYATKRNTMGWLRSKWFLINKANKLNLITWVNLQYLLYWPSLLKCKEWAKIFIGDKIKFYISPKARNFYYSLATSGLTISKFSDKFKELPGVEGSIDPSPFYLLSDYKSKDDLTRMEANANYYKGPWTSLLRYKLHKFSEKQELEAYFAGLKLQQTSGKFPSSCPLELDNNLITNLILPLFILFLILAILFLICKVIYWLKISRAKRV